LGVLVLIFVAFQTYVIIGRSDIESYPYQVIEEFEGFELREYEPRLFTSVQLNTGNFDAASSQGFSVLAGYIFGGNDRGEKIAMTSPVSMSLEENSTMMFMVPESYKKTTLPVPNQSEIEFVEEPGRKVAVVSFGGWANDDKIAESKKELTEHLKKENIEHNGNFYFMGYNAPFDLMFRKNEVMVELQR